MKSIVLAVITEVFVFARKSTVVMKRKRFNMTVIVLIENEAILW